MRKLNVLIACEFSGAIRNEFRKLGHNAISCDLVDAIEPSFFHHKGDVTELLDKNKYEWDLMIAHPPCTYLTLAGNRWFKPEYADKYPTRIQDRQDAVDFFLTFINADIPHIAVENPIGVMSSMYRKPDQIIQPWQFGDPFQKSTCLWLKNLPKLEHTDVVDKGEMYEFVSKKGVKKSQPKWYFDALNGKSAEERQKIRNTTFPGIASAVAKQYSEFVLNYNK